MVNSICQRKSPSKTCRELEVGPLGSEVVKARDLVEHGETLHVCAVSGLSVV